MRPSCRGPPRTGNVTSALSVASRTVSAARSSSTLRASSLSPIRDLSPLTACPKVLRASPGRVPSVAISSDTCPFLPSVAMRTRSRAARSGAAAISAVSARSRVARSTVLVIGDPALSLVPGIGSSTRLARDGRLRRVRSLAIHGAPGITPGTALGRLLRVRGGLVDESLEGRRVADGEVGQYLAVHGNAGKRKAADKSAVGDPMLARRRVDALDPKGTEGALAALAVAIGVLHRLLDRLLGDADGILAAAVVALGLLQDLLMLGVGRDAALDACHRS